LSGAVTSVCGDEFAGRELGLIEAFDRVKLTDVIENMRKLDFFRLREVQSVVSQIVRNKIRRILSPPQPKPPPRRTSRNGLRLTNERLPPL